MDFVTHKAAPRYDNLLNMLPPSQSEGEREETNYISWTACPLPQHYQLQQWYAGCTSPPSPAIMTCNSSSSWAKTLFLLPWSTTGKENLWISPPGCLFYCQEHSMAGWHPRETLLKMESTGHHLSSDQLTNSGGSICFKCWWQEANNVRDHSQPPTHLLSKTHKEHPLDSVLNHNWLPTIAVAVCVFGTVQQPPLMGSCNLHTSQICLFKLSTFPW